MSETIATSNLPIALYLVYVVITLGLIIWLARTLFRAGNQFLHDVFDSDELGEAVNRLLVTGFYLLNLGYAFLLYKLQPSYASNTEAWNQLINRLGILFVSLGVIHMFNMGVLWRVRTARDRRNAVPVIPASYQPPPPMGYSVEPAAT